MKYQFKSTHPSINASFNMLMNLPSPSSISYMWNGGSLLGIILAIQLLSGIFLSMHYCAHTDIAFNSIIHIMRDVSSGWLMRSIHMNGASMFFMLIYFHIARGLYYSSFKAKTVWISGTMILLILMATAFLGYVLPWGQMSFWGATVITNLVSTIPYLGQEIVNWLWGGFSVNNATLNRFYSLHFALPFILIGLVLIHLISLHESGSTNPTGMKSNIEKISFHPFFSSKDLMGLITLIMLLMSISMLKPYLFGDPDNFTPANPMLTPIHIQPEWYFLFAYAILRSIPNKLGGVIGLFLSIMILMVLPFKKTLIMSSKYNPIKKMFMSMLIMVFTILTWIGANPVEYPFESIGQMFSLIYFLLVLSI